MKDEVEKLRQEIEQEINAIAAGANRADLPKNIGILIPSLDLQAAIDRILALFQKAQVEAVRAEANWWFLTQKYAHDENNTAEIAETYKKEMADRLAKSTKEDGETK